MDRLRWACAAVGRPVLVEDFPPPTLDFKGDFLFAISLANVFFDNDDDDDGLASFLLDSICGSDGKVGGVVD